MASRLQAIMLARNQIVQEVICILLKHYLFIAVIHRLGIMINCNRVVIASGTILMTLSMNAQTKQCFERGAVK